MSRRGRPILPRWLAATLERLLGPDREWALGDLEERERARRTRGQAGAFSLARDVLSTVGWGVLSRLSGMSGSAAALLGDLRIAGRSLRRRPGYATAVVATLALGIGTVAAAFAVVDGIVLRPLAFPASERLVRLYRTAPGGDVSLDFSAAQVAALQDAPVSEGGLGAFSRAGRSLRIPGGALHNVGFARITSGFLEALGAAPRLGRLPTDAEIREGAPVIVLSERIWRTLFGSDPLVLGARVELDEVTHTVIGVLPAGHGFPEDAALWRPLTADERADDDPELIAVARLPNGVAHSLFAERLTAAVEASRADAPETWTDTGARAVPLHDALLGSLRRALLVLLGASGCVLLVAVANAASLQFVRGMEVRRDASVRTALGASRSRVVRGLVAESLFLGALGWGVGLALAALALPNLQALAPGEVPRLGDVALDARVAGVIAAITALAVLAGGLAPALSAARGGTATLRVGGGAAKGALRLGTLRTLISAQLGLTTVLLVAAGLLSVSLQRLITTPRGFDAEQLLLVPLALSSATWESPGGLAGLSERLIERTGSIPGVEAVAVGSTVPGMGRGMNPDIIGVSDLPLLDRNGPLVGVQAVSPSFFRTVGLPIVQGRPLPEGRSSEGTEAVVVNQAFARAFLGPEPWLGRRFSRGDASGGRRELEVVGVAADMTIAPGESPPPVLYVSTSNVQIFKNLFVRLDPAVPAAATIARVHDAIVELDPGQPVNVSAWMEDELGQSGARTRFHARLMSLFAALSLTLAAVGVYGVAAYGASQRRAELCLRRALGARRGGIVSLVMERALGTSLLGITAGLLGAALVSRLLQTLLFEVSPVEPLLYVAGAAALSVVALIAALAPALRVARDDRALAELLREG